MELQVKTPKITTAYCCAHCTFGERDTSLKMYCNKHDQAVPTTAACELFQHTKSFYRIDAFRKYLLKLANWNNK